MKKRRVAIFTDVHALLEPLEALLKDIEKRGITEIYSLGDNIGLGPNPREVYSLLEDYQIKCIAGNYEDHITLGVKPFSYYMNEAREENIKWLKNELTKIQKERISSFPHFMELELGGKKVALVHFANDVRFDFYEHSALYYPKKVATTNDAYKQFLYTNSKKELNGIAEKIGYPKELGRNRKKAFQDLRKWALERKKAFSPETLGYVSYLEDPLFYSDKKLRKACDYDAVIGGHVHFKIVEKTSKTLYYSTRAVAMGYKDMEEDLAHYIILQEQENGFTLEEVYVPYDKEKMAQRILSLKIPNDTIRRYTNI